VKRTIIALVCGLVAPFGCAIGVCTNQYDHDRRNHNVDKTVDYNDYEHNLRDGYSDNI